jgi:hypothetical protein
MSTRWKLMSALGATAVALAIGSAARADDAKCQDGLAKASRNVANQEQKKNRKCVKHATSSDIDACVDTEGAKSAKKRTKLTDLFVTGGKCDPVPALGVNDSGTPAGNDVALGTEDAAGDILRGVFGGTVNGIVPGDKCQDAIAKRAGKKFDTQLKAFRSCIKNAAPLSDQAAVDTCVAAGVNDDKAQMKVQVKLLNDMTKKCESGFPVPGMEDGDCASCTDAATCAACIGRIVNCQACEAANNSANGTADCEALDDGLANGSCGGPPPPCPIVEGRYTITYGVGGQLQVASIDGGTPGGFPFPTGGTIVQDVSAASPPDCVHTTVVPASGGFAVPVFCIPGLNFSVQVVQSGCGIGLIDSNGGSDFTIAEVGDTSDSSVTCNLPAVGCPPGPPSNVLADRDSSVRVDITVGDGAADICSGGATVNAVHIIPVQTTTWLSDDFTCPDVDGVFDGGDTIILVIDQNLDFTTDVSTSSWADIDGDGCSIAGAGPPAGLTRTGACLNLGTTDIVTVATGTIGSNGSPLFDLTFATRLPNTFIGPTPFLGATCSSPPAVDFNGTATRCIP